MAPLKTIKNFLKDMFIKIDYIPAEEIDEPTIWIQKQGDHGMRYIDVYESSLDIFLENGWEVWDGKN